MPVHYGNITDEHRAVRNGVGLFDISHMGRLWFQGRDAAAWLNRATTNDVAGLAEGQIQYSLMTDDRGGILDDILVYRTSGAESGPSRPNFLVVCNASNRQTVVDQFLRHRDGRDAELADATTDTAMIAVQGPAALETLQRLVHEPLAEMKYYHVRVGHLHARDGSKICEPGVSRTGYTGEDGFELITHGANAVPVWEALMEAGREFGIRPCGLGARDTLRFEAAMPLYGHELSESINPYEAGLGRFVKLDKGEFIGREALRALKDAPGRTRVGLALAGKRIARQDQAVLRGGEQVGFVTSGTFAPTLERSLAMAYVDPSCAAPGTRLTVDIRGHSEAAEVVPLPFYRRARNSKP
jgi:aminomethyltransferase